jgi:hypothetical protein
MILCLTCGNQTYFETDVETMKEVKTDSQGIIIEEAYFSDYNQGEEMIRTGLFDNYHATLKLHADSLSLDYYSQRCFNPYLSCAVCKSREVIFPSSTWTPKRKLLPLQDEILSHSNEYKSLRKEQNSENKLPVLRKQ